MDDAELSDALSSGELHLSGRQLPEVPQSVFACCGLLLLDLSANSLANLPVAFSELKSLTYLDISFNQLHELPACLGALTALTCLKASYNQIERLHPQALVGLGGCLRELHVGDNALTSAGVPPQLGCLTSLVHLDIRYNHNLTALPPELSCLAPPASASALASGPGLGRGPGPGLASTAIPSSAAKQPSSGGGGCLQYLGLEGCPLGKGCPVGASSSSGASAGAGAEPCALQQKQQQALYRRLQAAAIAAAAAVAGGEGGGPTAEAEAQKDLAEALRQLQRLIPVSQPTSSSTVASPSLWTGTPLLPGSGETATASSDGSAGPAMARAVEPRDARASNSGNGRVDVLILTPPSAQTSEDAVATSSKVTRGPVQAPGGAAVMDPETLGGLRSPLTGLRNSHADLELVDGDDEDKDPGVQAINIVGPGAAAAAVQSPILPAARDRGQTRTVATALARALEELLELPPAAAAAMYRSLDVVAAGVQEMREGRPLSRGGNPHATFAYAGGGAGSSGAPPLARPATAASRPASHHQRRPGSSSFRPGSSAGSSYSQDALPPRASSFHSSTPGCSTGPGPSSMNSGQQQSLTGVLALLAGAGMGPAVATGQRAESSAGGRHTGVHCTDPDAATMRSGGGEARGGLSAFGPITFPLASGVRGMLRGVGAAAIAAKVSTPTTNGPTAASMPTVSRRSGGAASWVGHGVGGEGAGAAAGEAALEGEDDVVLAAELDRLAMVRKLLAERNPELLWALDKQVFEKQ